MPVVSDNRPVESNNIPEESNNIPVESDDMHIDSLLHIVVSLSKIAQFDWLIKLGILYVIVYLVLSRKKLLNIHLTFLVLLHVRLLFYEY